jgi:thioester reductase-like protein/acyl-CoA synthetase (AMP-forming)/AMP-acid ligase II
LFSSPRNNIDAHCSLIEQTGCRILLRPEDVSESSHSELDTLVSKCNLYDFSVPTLHTLLQSSPRASRWKSDYSKDFTDTYVYLHTSGSTGLPKAVNMTHGLYTTLNTHQHLESSRSLNVQEWSNREIFVTFPPFHAAGFNFFGWSVYQGTVLIFAPSDTPPSVSTIERVLDLNLAHAGVIAPSILEELVKDDALLSKISRWSSVSFGGGPLSQAAGDALWEKTKVHPALGSTETNTMPELAPVCKDEWQYHNFHYSQGVEFRRHQDELHELVIVRRSTWKEHQPIFWTFPHLDEYHMKDLYEQHPSKPDLWAYRGRIDDIVVLSNGEKFSPAAAESIIANDPEVKSALVVGSGHDQAALLVELFVSESDEDLEGRRNSIMQRVQEANAVLPDHAQIHASHVAILPTSRSFLRSAKGEVRRAATVALLQGDISGIYASADNAINRKDLELDFANESELTSSLILLLSGEVYLGRRIDPAVNIFQCGFDSLKVMRLFRQIRTSMVSQGLEPTLPVAPKTVYQNPSPAKLAAALYGLLQQSGQPRKDSKSDDSIESILRTFQQKIEDLDEPPKTVVLTGSTGSLGSYMLDRLLRSTTVEKVVCLNRTGGTADRQAILHEKRGLATDFSKVQFPEVDLAEKHFGLGDETYQTLQEQTTHIIHNAWPVDFNLSLPSFEPQLEGCLQLLELAKGAPNLVNLSFMSSIGVANRWHKKYTGEIPETKIQDFDVAEDMGYAQSKLISELLLAQASEKFAIPTTICRIGQIAGPVMSPKGMWSPNEWFPSIVLSCKALGKVPADLGPMGCMDWIPVDVLADALTEALLASPSSETETLRYMHFVNPRKKYWKDIARVVAAQIGSDLEVVPLADWIDSLAALSEKSADVDNVPALKLLDFLRGMSEETSGAPTYSTKSAEAASRSLREIAPVSVAWMECWLSQWRTCG